MSQTEAVRADSVNSQDPHNVDEKKKTKNRRPANTAFRQQRLKAWQPILTPKTVLPLFFAIGIIFAPIGGLLLYASAQVQELVIDYSDCNTTAPLTDDPVKYTEIPNGKVTTYFKAPIPNPPTWGLSMTNVSYGPSATVLTPVCSLQFQIPDNIGPPVYFYYRLTNFYQNHRRYVKSLDTSQLQGTAVPAKTIGTGTCDPLKLDANGKPYYPCGLIANSVFNDTFAEPVLLNVPRDEGGGDNRTYAMTDKGISWSTDAALYGPTQYNFDQIAVPPNWAKRWPNGYSQEDPPPNLKEDEAFQVWMRTAGLPAFSKLARRNDNQTMVTGRYQLDIQMNFPVTEYGGTKSIVLSTRTVMGGRNPFLGIAYIVVAGICVVLGAIFTITHLIKPRKLGDHTYLTWNNNDNEQRSAITATGVSRPGADSA
ncbi:hypothetical protein MMC09_005634 [Bachmanniomyces sp. S44760]|nr:hypothetical protein [Bachmanniomyces sp. S44760]